MQCSICTTKFATAKFLHNVNSKGKQRAALTAFCFADNVTQWIMCYSLKMKSIAASAARPPMRQSRPTVARSIALNAMALYLMHAIATVQSSYWNWTARHSTDADKHKSRHKEADTRVE